MCRHARYRLLDHCTFEVRREHLDKRKHVTAQVVVAPDADVDRVGLEEVARIDRAVERDVGDDGDAEPELDVGLDDVRVDGIERNVRP